MYVLGPDGVRIRPSVGEWLNRAEERDGDYGPVLFVLDVCMPVLAVGYQLRAWWMCGVSRHGCWPHPAVRIRYDGRLTRALTQVLEGFRSGELQVDPSVRYIPLQRIFAEVDRLVRGAVTGSYPQQIHSSYVPLHANIDQLEFFPTRAGTEPSRQRCSGRGRRWPCRAAR